MRSRLVSVSLGLCMPFSPSSVLTDPTVSSPLRSLCCQPSKRPAQRLAVVGIAAAIVAVVVAAGVDDDADDVAAAGVDGVAGDHVAGDCYWIDLRHCGGAASWLFPCRRRCRTWTDVADGCGVDERHEAGLIDDIGQRSYCKGVDRAKIVDAGVDGTGEGLDLSAESCKQNSSVGGCWCCWSGNMLHRDLAGVQAHCGR